MSSALVRQIAASIGVTERTVQRVLAGQGAVERPALAARAQQIRVLADSLGYRPNAAAKAIGSGCFGAVGVLCTVQSDSGSRLPEPFMRGLLQGLSASGTRLVVSTCDDDAFSETGTLPDVIAQWSVDALIVNYNAGFPKALDAAIDSLGTRFLWHNRRLAANALHPDDAGGMQELMQRVRRAGHRHLVYVDPYYQFDADHQRLHYSNVDRLTVVRKQAENLGMQVDIWLTPPTDAEWEQTLRNASLTCVVGTNFDTLQQAERAAWRCGRPVPVAVSLVGIGDEDDLRSYAGMGIPQFAIGERAAVWAVSAQDWRSSEVVSLRWCSGPSFLER